MDVSGRIRLRQHLSADSLIALVRQRFLKVPEPRRQRLTIPTADALMAAFAMFSLKCPSLLAFDQHRRNGNLPRIFGMRHVPCDTQMRQILDPVDPMELRRPFRDVFTQVQRGGLLPRFRFLKEGYLLVTDGTEYFQSPTIHCPSCLTKHHRDGTVTYHHQLLGASLVHPDRATVIPFCPEPIQRQDGNHKNDCELTASRRFFAHLRREHPHLELIVVEDALYANGPHLQLLQEHHLHYILCVKEGSQSYLFEQFSQREAEGRILQVENQHPKTGVTQLLTIVRDVSLNEAHPDLRVTFLECFEYDSRTEAPHCFHWITDLVVTPRNAARIARAGRAKWKIENETFNTLKEHGYHLGHNFGHGQQHLAENLVRIMMLAFLVDQVQQLACPLFQAAWEKSSTSKRRLWEDVRSIFHHVTLQSMSELYQRIRVGWEPDPFPALARPEPARTAAILDSS